MKTTTAEPKLKFAFEINRKIPERGYRIQSLVHMPMVDGEADYDNAKYKNVYVATHGEALAKARELLPGDFWGAVQIDEYELSDRDEPMCNFIEWLGETEYVERE